MNEMMCSSHLLVISLLFTICIANKCVSNRVGSSSVVNGEYVDDGLNEGKPSYTLTNSLNCSGTFYLYYHDEGNSKYRWWIGPEKGGVTYWARCSEHSDTPNSCSSWTFPSNNNNVITDIIDSDVTVNDGSCPILICDALQITGSSYPSGCDGLFHSTINDNVFLNSNTNRFWYWYPEFNQWFCAETVERDCSPTVSASGGNRFNQIGLGALTTMNTQSGSVNTTATVKCVDNSQTTTMDPNATTAPRVYTGVGVCLWDVIISGVGNIFNGYYAEVDYDKNGKNYYAQTTGCDAEPILYIYYIGPPTNTIEIVPGEYWNGGWIITKTNPETSTDFAAPIHGWCLSNVDSPAQCGSNWRFSDNTTDSYSIYPTVQSINGECPTLNCAQLDIISTSNNNPCVGTYYPLISGEDNVFKRDDNSNYYWLFNPNAFYWICNQGGYSKTCSIKITNGDYAPNGWSISYPSFSFQSRYRSGSITFKCYDKVLTPNPTKYPTNIPTKSPTMNTKTPSITPTERMGTESPTETPTGNTPAPNSASGSIGDSPTTSPTDHTNPSQGDYISRYMPSTYIIFILMTLCAWNTLF